MTIALTACGNATPTTDESDDVASRSKAANVEVLPAKFNGANTGTYSLEKSHAFLWFEVSHNGISTYRVNFTDFHAALNFDPLKPVATHNNIVVTINPASVVTNYPGDYKAGHAKSPYTSWDEDLAHNPKLLNAGKFPKITFTSTALKRTGDYTGKLTGDLAFLGVTKPVTMDITYNGTGNKPWFGERDLIGFNASTMIKRSEFGMDQMLQFLGDDVKISFTGEFLQDEN